MLLAVYWVLVLASEPVRLAGVFEAAAFGADFGVAFFVVFLGFAIVNRDRSGLLPTSSIPVGSVAPKPWYG